MKLLLLPLIAPLAIVWLFVTIFLLLLPAEVIAFSLIALGYDERGEAVLEWAIETMFFQTAPWTWLRDA